VFEGNYSRALALLDTSNDTWIRIKIEAAPKVLYAALVHLWLGDRRRGMDAMEEARGLLEAEVRAIPDDGRYHSSLGVVYAALGRRDDAVREGTRGITLLPLTTDAVYGIPHVIDLAHIHALLGEEEGAIAQLEVLLSHPGWISASWLRMDPRWRSLDTSPRFQALLAKSEARQ
jgi:tetratricopeptide (TPR) repeat protein